MRWDIFCKVVDNFGDMGVCWRLSRDLAARGAQVRLWTDDASPLCWMAPEVLHDGSGAPGIVVMPWQPDTDWSAVEPGDVVILDIRAAHRGSTEEACQSPACSSHPRILVSTVLGRSDGELTKAMEMGNFHRLMDWVERHP